MCPLQALHCAYGADDCTCQMTATMGDRWHCNPAGCPNQNPGTGMMCALPQGTDCKYGMVNCVCNGTSFTCM
jgi:hypothetical protein